MPNGTLILDKKILQHIAAAIHKDLIFCVMRYIYIAKAFSVLIILLQIGE